MADCKSETPTEKETPKPKPRPIVRLGIFLISHSFLVSVVCCTAGVLALLLLPVLAKNTYISENALMPGSASPIISNQEVLGGNKLVKDLTNLNSKYLNGGIGGQGIIAKYMSDLGDEVSYHKFHPQSNRFHPLHFFSDPDFGAQENFSCSSYGINTIGIVRAPRADESFSVDSRYGEYASVAAWLKDYHVPKFSSLSSPNVEMCHDVKNLYESEGKFITGDFRHAGTMAAVPVLKVSDRTEELEDMVSIYAEASADPKLGPHQYCILLGSSL
ncbi:hypothetical protein SLEP1_g45278 [Rubroshorea leprosula]|uniref:Uncharacterized protein n=1 Tax=Rubroshorea leprosula TaxID=152421 RepID=A0AAV5LIK4_9ROSI|nr:hypothetical protein SLEP1_g45278 [Rubroshorea leprosula]